MIQIRKREELGHTELDWLQATHHFCFAGYQARDRLNWGRLRVLNRTRLAARSATLASNYANIELLFLVSQGMLEIVRSNGAIVQIGSGQAVMIHAGIGIEFAVRNPLGRPTTFTTIWLTCDPSDQRAVVHGPVAWGRGDAILAAGLGEVRGAVPLNSPARISSLSLDPRQDEHEIPVSSELAYLLVRRGEVELNGQSVIAEEGAAIAGETMLRLRSCKPSTLLLLEV